MKSATIVEVRSVDAPVTAALATIAIPSISSIIAIITIAT